MNEKINDPECVKKKVKIAPHDYSKENYLASFTPQKELTPEQIFWSKDLIKMKAGALKEQTTTSRPMKALMVYSPNTPATLVPRMLPTKISRFSNMHEALNAAQKRIAELEFENSNLQNKIQNDDHDVMAQLREHHKSNCVTMPAVKSKVLAPGRYVIDIEPIPPCIRNNREAHLDYLKHLKESVETLCEIVEEAKVERPLDRSLASACLYTKHSQELLEYMIGTCLKDFNQRDKKPAAITVLGKKQVTFVNPCETFTNNTLTHVKQQTMHQTKEPVIPSTGVNRATAASGSKTRSNTKKDMTLPAKSDMQKVILEEPASSTGTLSSLQNFEKELSFTDQFFLEKQQEEELRKTNVKAEVSKAVAEIVTDVINWAMQAPLRARFNDMPTVEMKEILQQRMFKSKSYEAHEDHKKLYDALEKLLERDYSDQLLSNLEEAHQKKIKRRDLPRTPSGSPLPQPSPPPSPAGASDALGSEALSSSKSATSAPQFMAWTTSNTRYESAGVSGTQELSPIDSLIQDDSILGEQVHLSDDEDFEIDHLPQANSRKDWWKPLPEEERPATLEPTWTIPSYSVPNVENNWATTLVSTYETSAENSLLAKTGNMKNFLNCGPPGHVTIQSQFLFNKDLEYLRYGSKGSSPALLISKIKAASYPDFGLELLVQEQMWIEDVCTYDISAKYGIFHWWFNRQNFYIDRHDSPSRRKEVYSHIRILSVIRIKAYSRYGCDYLSEIVLRIADLQEHTIVEKYFKNLYPSDFKDMNLLLLQSHLDHLPGFNKRMLSTAVKLWTRNLVIRQRVKDFQLEIESYQTQLNLTNPIWDATCYEFKHDYTIIESP
uniref:Uncharacterized protein n=1 Tax=Tanacetum cinerariifolium TaxID=118510 RepID=A0A6L2P6G0_TANCI|nr:hypothetical protein [Tanacetum cinerariifolium]